MNIAGAMVVIFAGLREAHRVKENYKKMTEKKKIPTSIYAEMTPNPSSMKFVADRTLITGGLQVEYRKPSDARGSSPLAEELFNFPFVTNVFISGNFVTVTKDDSLGWEMIVQQLREYIREWLMDNEVVVSVVPSRLLRREKSTDTVSPTATIQEKVDYSTFEETEYDDAIIHLLDEFVRPAVERDGGAIDFKAYKDKKVYVQLKGSCSGCPSSSATLKGGIERILKAKMPDVVEEVVTESV
ncbi:MAG: NifU family protein [Crocinitomicaceae bacterium]|nr:NifU family protein [Crocinitomicaceae bacterium]